MLGGFFALLAATTFALNNASIRRGVLTGSVFQAMAITVPIGVPIFLMVALATDSLSNLFALSNRSLLLFASAGLIHFVWGRYCNYRATRAIGSNLVATVQQLSLVVTIFLALTILGEVLTPFRILGIVLVLLGPALSHSKKEAKGTTGDNKPAAQAPASFVPKYAEGYLFALLSTTGYGVSPILLRLALEGRNLGDSIAGGLVAYTAGAVGMIVIIFSWPGRPRHVLAVNRESAKWFTFSGILVCLSQLFFYMALALVPVTVATPINRLSLIFRLYLSKLINPDHEVFGGRIVFGTVVSLVGAVILSLSTDVVLQFIQLPQWANDVLLWQWP